MTSNFILESVISLGAIILRSPILKRVLLIPSIVKLDYQENKCPEFSNVEYCQGIRQTINSTPTCNQTRNSNMQRHMDQPFILMKQE